MAKLSAAVCRADIRKLIKDGFIIKKPEKVHSRYWANTIMRQKLKGRHRGPGKVRGTKNARMPEKDRWMKKIREMRAVLKQLRKDGQISPTEHKHFYMQAKGNLFKNAKSMAETIIKKQEEAKRMSELNEQAKALKTGV